ncbi:hypothetical protein NC651_023015 [Populus alba x Populus x berolinensis]|nr:hypothetical protein NC651_023015 [Populus alba x Populus x berolinensis]
MIILRAPTLMFMDNMSIVEFNGFVTLQRRSCFNTRSPLFFFVY